MSLPFNTSALFWSLLWQSTVLFGLGLLASRSLCRRVGQAHFVLFLSLVMSLLLPVGNAVVGWNGWGLLTPAPAPVSVEYSATPSIGNIELEAPPVQLLENPPVPLLEDPAPILSRPSGGMGGRFEWLVWGVGGVTVLLLARLALNFLGGVRLLARARPLVHERVQRLLETASERIGVSRTPVIFSTSKVRCPAIWCWALHPALLLPETMTQDPDRLKDADWVGIFCHELSHLKRRDHLAAIVSELACCLFWWQPLVWFSRNRLHHLSDEACDYWAVTQGQSAPDYAELLVHMAAQPRSLTALSMVGSRKRLRERVDFILKVRPGQLRLKMRWIAGALLLAVGLTTFLACIQKRRVEQMEQSEPIVTRVYKPDPDNSERVKALVEAVIQSENAKNGDKQPDPKCQVTLDDSKTNLRVTDTISNLQKVEELLAHIGEHLGRTEDDALTVQTFEIKRNGVPLDPKSYADSSFFKSTYEQIETLLYTERGRDASADLGWKMRPDRNKLDVVTDFKIEITDTKRRLRDVADFLKLAKAGEVDTETSNPTDVSDQKTGEVLMPTRVYALNPAYSHRTKALVDALTQALAEKAGDQELDRYRQCRFQDDKMNTLLVKDTISNLRKVDEAMMNLDSYYDRKENEAPQVYTEQSPPQPWQISTGTFKVKPDSVERVKARVEALIQSENARNGNGQPDSKCRIEYDRSREELAVTDTISNIRKIEEFFVQLSEAQKKDLTSQSWHKGPFVEGVEYLIDTQVTRNGHPTLCLKKTAERYFPIAEWIRQVPMPMLEGARQLRLSGWVRAEKARKAILDVQFMDANGQWRHQWAAYIGSKNQNEPPVDHDWKRYEGVVDVPEGTREVTIGLQIYGPGTVWFDEVELAPL
jgi:beta-lactamase regulating signal transducer with metallopeptidase domain